MTQSLLSDSLLSDLTADPNNARRHSPQNLDTISLSLQEVGAARSIVIDEDGVILAGNATAQAAEKAGIQKVQIVDADGDTLIAVRRRGLSADQKTRLALFDNRANDLSEFDPLILAGLQAEGVSLEGLWNADELDALLADLPHMESMPGTDAFPKEITFHVTPSGIQTSIQTSIQSTAERDQEQEARRESYQPSEVSPRPPSADTHPYQPPAEFPASPVPVPGLDKVAGLDRVTPDNETSRSGLFLHFRGLKIPLSTEEGAALDARLSAYREETGAFYGFIGKLLGQEATEGASHAERL